MNKNYLKKYARLIVKAGLNVQCNQIVVIRAPIASYELVRLIVTECYEANAYDVIVRYSDEIINHERYLKSNNDVFEYVEQYESDFYNQTAKRKACYLTLVGDDPDLMKDVDLNRMVNYQRAFRSATKYYRTCLDQMENQWCIAAVSTPAWAKKVYPNLTESAAVDKLWESIFYVSRIDENDPIDNWNQHRKSFERKVNALNSLDIDYFHYTNSLGTDLYVRMPEDYIFCGGGSYLKDGTYYFPNIPTEEVFSMPHRLGVNGHLVASCPLCHNGCLVEDFWFDFKDGQVVDYGAKKDVDVIKSILEVDENSSYLGEIALVPYNSPISKLNTLFYETLIDENASCHFALGQSYGECIKGGLEQSESTLLKRGANQSLSHVDFMIGTEDLKITAITKSKQEILIFEQGKFTQEFD